MGVLVARLTEATLRSRLVCKVHRHPVAKRIRVVLGQRLLPARVLVAVFARAAENQAEVSSSQQRAAEAAQLHCE